MCPREKMKRPQGVLDIGLYKKVLDEAVTAGARQVSLENYGESFMDPYIFERASYARSKGLEVYTITNASLLDDKKIRKTLELFTKIRVSMYGITRPTYEKIHRGLSFEKVKKNVDNLFRLRKNTASPLRIEMYFLLVDENRNELEGFLKTYGKVSDGVSVWKPHNWGDGRSYRKSLGTKKVSCGRPFTGPLQIQWNGLVVPCCFDYDSRIVLGDLKKQTLHEVLHGDAYKMLKEAHMSGDFSKYPFCDVCDQLQKRDDVLVYTTINNSRVGATNTAYYDLTTKKAR
jgi:hypothetical protein